MSRRRSICFMARPSIYLAAMGLETVSGRVEEVQLRIADACRRSGRAAEEVTVVAATKGVGTDAIRESVAAGVCDLGENRVQEAQSKRPMLDLPAHVKWHMIGHLQSNKAKTATRLFDIIHSVDSLHLAEAISDRASPQIRIFLEVNVAEEASKYGFALGEVESAHRSISRLPNIEVIGLMTVAPQVDRAETCATGVPTPGPDGRWAGI